MNKLINMKHWLLLVSMLIPAIVINAMDLTGLWGYFGTIWCYSVYSFWLFSIGTKVYKANSNSPFTIFLFKTAFVYPLICLIFLVSYKQFSESFPIWLIPFIIVLIFFEFYLIFFVSKNFFNFEKKHGIESGNVFSIFCAFWFFPIGIFFIQPRVNKIENLGGDINSNDSLTI